LQNSIAGEMLTKNTFDSLAGINRASNYGNDDCLIDDKIGQIIAAPSKSGL